MRRGRAWVETRGRLALTPGDIDGVCRRPAWQVSPDGRRPQRRVRAELATRRSRVAARPVLRAAAWHRANAFKVSNAPRLPRAAPRGRQIHCRADGGWRGYR